MNARTILNLALLSLITGLGLLAYLQPGIDEAILDPPITALTPARIEHIHIERPNKEALTFSRRPTGWFITEPIMIKANNFRIDSLLELATATSHNRFVANETKFDQFELIDPLARIQLNNVEITFGGTEPLNDYRYVLIGQTIHLISDRFYYQLLIDVPNFVDLKLLPQGLKLSEIILPEFKVKHDKNGDWRIAPIARDITPENISMDAINTFVDEWQRAQAIQISTYHNEHDQVEKIMITHEQGEIVFHIIEHEPEVILARSDIGMRYHLTPEQGKRLLRLSASAENGDVGPSQ